MEIINADVVNINYKKNLCIGEGAEEARGPLPQYSGVCGRGGGGSICFAEGSGFGGILWVR